LLNAFNSLVRPEAAEGRILAMGTRSNAWKNPEGFGAELSQFQRIYFTSEGLSEMTKVTLAEIEFLLKHREFWAITYIVK
jgi:hypothetical protein